MPAVRPGDPDWHWYDGDDETEARRKCTALRRCGWPVRLERIEQQPLMPAGVVKVETLRAEHERSQQSTPAH
jgi:hypothetical protein